MTFANPWGLLALLALPAIIVIHMYHRRFPPLVVGGLHLWGVETQTRTAGRRRERLPITASLLLELLAALLLALVLARPQFTGTQKATHLVVVLDDSASMSAQTLQGQTFREKAVADLNRRIEDLPGQSVLTLILTGRRPVMLAGPRVDPQTALQALENWKPTAAGHDFHSAWDLAAQLAEESGRLLFYTDRLPGGEATPVPKRMEIAALGQAGENVAITTARWLFDSQTATGNVFLRIGNYGNRAADVAVLGRTGERIVFRQTVAVEAGGSVSLETEVPGGLGRLEVELQVPGDRLALDNRVTLIEPKVRTVDVAVRLPVGHPAVDPLRRVLDQIPDLYVGDTETPDLVITTADPLPPSRPDLWWLGVGPLDLNEQKREEAKDLIGPYLVEKRNPLVDGVVLGGVIWGGVQPVTLEVLPIITAGRYPLLAQLKGTRTTAYLLNIDLSRPNLTDSPDWPILIKNLIDLRREDLPGLRRWNYRVNEEVQFRLPGASADPVADDPNPLTLVHDGNSRPLARSDIVEVPPLTEPGIYEIRDGETSLGEFAVNFHDHEESTLLGLSTGRREPAVQPPANGFRVDQPYSWLILLGLLLILAAVLLDWKVLLGKRPQAPITRSP